MALYSQLQSKFEEDINRVDGFMQMQVELNKEKQKQIDTVLLNTTSIYGSIKGIAGSAIENVAALELEYMDDEE